MNIIFYTLNTAYWETLQSFFEGNLITSVRVPTQMSG